MEIINLKKVFIFLGLALLFSACTQTQNKELSLANVDASSGKIVGVDRNQNLQISDVFCKYVEDYQTRSIWEALTGNEYTYGHLVLRSQPEQREGMYFTIMLPWNVDSISIGTIIEIEVDSSMTAKTRKFTFTVPQTHSTIREIKLGITGLDWKGEKERVNAWKVAIKTPAGNTITEKKSWLWSLKK